jgi:hypothetical protein
MDQEQQTEPRELTKDEQALQEAVAKRQALSQQASDVAKQAALQLIQYADSIMKLQPDLAVLAFQLAAFLTARGGWVGRLAQEAEAGESRLVVPSGPVPPEVLEKMREQGS